MKIFIKKYSFFVLLIIWFFPSFSLAANMSVSATRNIFRENEEFLAEVFLDTEDAHINAVEAELVFPSGLLEIKEIRNGNSSINFWIEKPEIKETGKIVFSGITAGGIRGQNNFLFSIVFQSKKTGEGSMELHNIQILQNDGLGTKVSTTSNPFIFSISDESTNISEDLTVNDMNPPEDFTPFVAQDEAMFDGKYFLVFSTVDKGAGIDDYEVREGLWGKYITAESPHLLEDQSLGKSIYVKALDESGNERVVRIKAPNRNFRLEIGLIFAILLMVVYFLRSKKLWSKLLQ